MQSESFNRIKSTTKHLLITVGSGIFIILFFFYIYLPATTNHGESITVPDVKNQHLSDLDDILVSRSLRYEVNADSGYSSAAEPLAVLDQFPKANAKVKENRKIYVTLNAKRPPLVRMPNLIDKSLKIAQITLESFDLRLGRVDHVPDNALNAVIYQLHRSIEIEAGQMLPKGSMIDLKVGDGRGNRYWKMYKYTGQSYEDAKIAIIGTGLKIGAVTHVLDPEIVVETVSTEGDTTGVVVDVSVGDVVKQRPVSGRTVKIQDIVDLWVYQPDSLASDNSILDQENQ
ncbi:MAG: penicillin-binding protein [Cytophagales bacterium]|nr:penicillin-binding protein [Cytophagales bacterium]